MMANNTTMPPGMKSIPMSLQQRRIVEEQSLKIYNEMIDSGYPLREALSAVFLSGLILSAELKAKHR